MRKYDQGQDLPSFKHSADGDCPFHTESLWGIDVFDDSGCPRGKIYWVDALTEDGARVKAFLLDGGWGTDPLEDALGLLALAKTWTEVRHAPNR